MTVPLPDHNPGAAQPTCCPACRGAGRTVVHVDGVRDGKRFGEWRQAPCSTCDGSGHVTEARATQIAEGDRLRADRLARGMTLRQEAERLGCAPVELSRREQGQES